MLIVVAGLAIMHTAIGRLQQPQPLEQLGSGLVKLTGLTILDPLIAIAVALNIVVTGWKLFHETASGLLDRCLSDPEQQVLEDLLASCETHEIQFHALRTRVAGSRRFVSFHVLVPGNWSTRWQPPLPARMCSLTSSRSRIQKPGKPCPRDPTPAES